MEQKVITIGNSGGIIIPKELMKKIGIKIGETVVLNTDSHSDLLFIAKKDAKSTTPSITPEFYEWLKKFNARYKDALTELAKK